MSEIRVSEIRVSKIRGSKIRGIEIRVTKIRNSSNHRELHGAIFFSLYSVLRKRSQLAAGTDVRSVRAARLIMGGGVSDCENLDKKAEHSVCRTQR